VHLAQFHPQVVAVVHRLEPVLYLVRVVQVVAELILIMLFLMEYLAKVMQAARLAVVVVKTTAVVVVKMPSVLTELAQDLLPRLALVVQD
jgi:hypothetical protein